MNTIQYFLSTLRPAPPPSPRASTSGVRIENDDLPLDPDPIPAGPSSLRVGDLASVEAQMRAVTGQRGGLANESEAEAVGSVNNGDDDRPTLPVEEDSTESDASTSTTASSTGRPTGKDPDRGVRQTAGLALEDPLRDGASIRTEVDRGEGVELANIVPLPPSASHEPTQPYRPSPDPNSTANSPNATLIVREKSTAAASTAAWPWLTRLARWWPIRMTATVYVLLRRFLGLFALPLPSRPGYNALLAPPQSNADTPTHPTTWRGGPALSTDEEKGTRPAQVVSLALQVSHKNVSSPGLPYPGSRSHSPAPSLSHSSSIPRAPAAPPRLTPKTLVLDLDETLIHSTSRAVGLGGKRGAPKGLKTRVVEVVLDGRSTVYTVYKRPWVDFFLRKVSSWYTVVIFTASLPEYADPVIDWLDGGDGRGGMVGARLFRADCVARNGSYMKDLTVVEPDLSRVCLVDNSPASYAINQANGIPIEGWINDPTDECLLDLLPMLDSLRFTNDVRRVLGLRGFGKSGGDPLLNRPVRSRAR